MLSNIIRNNNGTYSPVGEYERLRTNAGCSVIYKKEDILKIYCSYIPDTLRISEEMFKIMRDINNSNFIRLKDYYMDRKMIAYTSEYIEHEERLNILNKDLDYVKYNLIELEKLMLLFTKLGIAIVDVNYRNYLANKDNIVLIDPDCYKLVDDDERGKLKAYNYKKLLDSFFDLFVKSYYKVSQYYKIGSEMFNRMMDGVFHYDKEDKDPVYTACKRLENLRLEHYKKN